MLDNLAGNEKKTRGNRIKLLQKDTGNSKKIAAEKNTSTQNQKRQLKSKCSTRQAATYRHFIYKIARCNRKFNVNSSFPVMEFSSRLLLSIEL